MRLKNSSGTSSGTSKHRIARYMSNLAVLRGNGTIMQAKLDLQLQRLKAIYIYTYICM